MRELFFKLFEKSHFNTGISITPFSISHIVYLFLIFGSIITVYLLFNKKSDDNKEKVLRVLSYALVISYISDFFVHDFVYDGMNIDKLPFHLCTILCPLSAFAQFNNLCKKFREPIAVLAIVGPLMYLVYPANIGSGEPWCYQAIQTMFFHGVEMTWGLLSITLGIVKLNFKHIWKVAALLGCITLWAKFGNLILEHNWFFLEKDALYLGLVEDGIIPKWSLMIITPFCVFAISSIIYLIDFLIEKVKYNNNVKRQGTV